MLSAAVAAYWKYVDEFLTMKSGNAKRLKVDACCANDGFCLGGGLSLTFGELS